ncbi:hypothetical protein SAMN05421788_1011515 [Filimonas lacunae]|uniref:Uncharacterized protein n=1 Tax=Filimonas lacunae TaxID=477680 RepID=A0A173MRF6_9BACT|nr:hypothetical protein [Filimonas lacunae]BAV10086.1 hypothetical protein FLA_6141 [Filimonas lacunae]SIS83794.1 hypothetical protein SAMN05421788_1011515 [Filimonas lacunae]
MKKLKIAILAIAVIASIGGVFANKKRGSQYFYLEVGETVSGKNAVKTAGDQENPPSSYCEGGSNAYICRILTNPGAPAYQPGDLIPRADFTAYEFYSAE